MSGRRHHVRKQPRRRRALATERCKRGWRAAAREVILAAGSIGSTQIMLLSGVGPAQHLAEHGIAVVADRPGVGANLQDHLQLRLIYKVDGIRTLNERYHAPWASPACSRNMYCFVAAR